MIKKISLTITHIIISTLWLYILRDSDSAFSVNFCVALFSMASMVYLIVHQAKIREKGAVICSGISAFIFSLCNVLANYSTLSVIEAAVFFLSGFYISGVIFAALTYYFDHKTVINPEKPIGTGKIFFISFLLMSLVNLCFLFLFASPGNLTMDSMDQVRQCLTGDFNNHHPFWYTMIINLFVQFGQHVLGNLNTGIILYSAFQILFNAFCFSYITVSLYQVSLSKGVLILSGIWFILMPYQISYSVTMWKDIIYGVCAAVFTVTLLRIIRRIGTNRFNLIILLLSGIGFGIFRSNGLIALGITFLFLLFFFFRKNKKAIAVVLASIVIAFLLTSPVVKLLSVKPVRFVESLSIPLQQISRAVVDEDNLTKEQEELLEKIISADTVKEKYKPEISDPIKFSISDEQDQYLSEHKGDYLKLWIDIGLSHPRAYIKAWIDQTKGYWNGCYDRWRWANELYENDYGIKKITPLPAIDSFYRDYFNLFQTSFMKTFLAIGLFTQFFVFSLIYYIKRKNKELILTIPVLSNIATLLIATPVYAEFRYIYLIFISFPILIASLISLNRSKAQS